MDNVTFADHQSFMQVINRRIGDNMFVFSKHVLILISFILSQSSPNTTTTKTTFVLNALNAKVIESKYNMKLNKPLIFTTQDVLYHNAKNMRKICVINNA